VRVNDLHSSKCLAQCKGIRNTSAHFSYLKRCGAKGVRPLFRSIIEDQIVPCRPKKGPDTFSHTPRAQYAHTGRVLARRDTVPRPALPGRCACPREDVGGRASRWDRVAQQFGGQRGVGGSRKRNGQQRFRAYMLRLSLLSRTTRPCCTVAETRPWTPNGPTPFFRSV